MAPVPKRKHSTQRSRKREEKLKIDKFPNTASCPNCGASKRPHYICKECGYYKDKEIIQKKSSKKKKNK